MSDTEEVEVKDVDEVVKEDISNPDVLTKYKKAGEIANAALEKVVALCVEGAKVLDVCSVGDDWITSECGSIYNNKKGMIKGIGFPTCLSVNNIVGHYSPMGDDVSTLKSGDIVKIDLGVQIDGYCGIAAHTVVVGGAEKATGAAGNVLAAAHTAAELAIRMIKVGLKNAPITEMFDKVAKDFKVNIVQGVLSHQMTRHIIDGAKVIISKTDVEHKVDEIEFEPNEVYAIDIVYSTGEGKPTELSDRPTVYKRQENETYQLKMKASRAVFGAIKKDHPTFPFTIRALDAKTSRFGIKECHTHKLVQAYPVLSEKEGDVVAHVKFTVAVTANGAMKICGLPVVAHESENSLTDEELRKTMMTAISKKKKKGGNKKKK